MQPAVVPQSLVAERRRLGLDKKDEMWEGVLHVLLPVAKAMGLEVLPEAGVCNPLVADYGRVGVRELLIIDRDTKAVRRWLNVDCRLDEQPPGQGGRHGLVSLPVDIWGVDGKLCVQTETGLTEI